MVYDGTGDGVAGGVGDNDASGGVGSGDCS